MEQRAFLIYAKNSTESLFVVYRTSSPLSFSKGFADSPRLLQYVLLATQARHCMFSS